MPSIGQVIDDNRILICAGSGGVGKTTTSAAIALGMAAQGLKVCVLTIDPAKRLADSLGLKELGNEASRVDPKLFAEQVMPQLQNMWPDWDGDDRWWIHPLDTRVAPEATFAGS